MPGFVLDGCARLAAGFQDAARTIRGEGNGEDDPIPAYDPRAKLFRQMHQVVIAPPLLVPASGTAVLTTPVDLLGPNTGFHWSVRRLNLTGYSSGNVTVYRNATQTSFTAGSLALTGEILMPPSPAGTFTFGRGEMLLEPDDSLVFLATGIVLSSGSAGVTIYGSADQFESWLLPDYLM